MLANHAKAPIAIQQVSNGNHKGMAQVTFKKASPCPVGWSQMSGDNKVRWCQSCKHFTYNRQKESLPTVLSWIWFREGLRPEVLFVREDGAVMTVDCQAGARKNDAIRNGKIAAGVAIALLILAALSAPTSQSSQQPPTVESPATAQPEEQARTPAESASKQIAQSQSCRHTGTWVIPNLKSSPNNEQPTFQQVQTEFPAAITAEQQTDIAARNRGGATNTNQGTLPVEAPALKYQSAPAPQSSGELSSSKSLVQAEPPSAAVLAKESSSQPTISHPESTHYVWDSRLSAGKN